MAVIKNPVTVCGGGSTAKLTIASTLTTPPAVKAYLDSVLPYIPEIQEGKFYAINKQDWTYGSAYKLCMFSVEDGSIATDNGATVSTSGNIMLRAWTTASNIRISAGDVFEFIKAERHQ